MPRQTRVAAAPMPGWRDERVLLATVCNTVPSVAPFALWLGRGADQAVVDLTDVLNEPGDVGLTGLAWHAGRFYIAVQSAAQPRIVGRTGGWPPCTQSLIRVLSTCIR